MIQVIKDSELTSECALTKFIHYLLSFLTEKLKRDLVTTLSADKTKTKTKRKVNVSFIPKQNISYYTDMWVWKSDFLCR